jgi:hypothetical protein
LASSGQMWFEVINILFLLSPILLMGEE